ncbi:MAG: ribonuclease R [Gammaproteobacteria bacterium]|nr:ribonuclease R [Gammaproteobacteria bacterium]
MSKHSKDPFAEREAKKYDNPIASREFILSLLEQTGIPMRLEEIARALQIQDEEQQSALHRRLRAMERDGQILFNRRRQYCLASKIDLISGRVIAHPNGFGFLVPDKGGDDLFLPASEMRVLMHGDRAAVREIGQDRRGRREAVVVEVLERAVHRVVGRLFIEAGVGFVIADNKRITHDVLIPREDFYGAHHGQMVTVEIREFPTRNRQAIGRVIEILGDHMAPGMEIDIAIRNYDLPQVWSDAVETEIRNYREVVQDQDKRGREDLTQLPLVTIDGEDARDFDDAVYCERKGKGFRLIVAIADVSHYVKPGTALDAEARHRGNSVYFPERVIPMLPEILSNGLCSLNPQIDRLCMACEMDINASGVLKKYRFFPAVMHSHARLTYTKVAAMLVDQDTALRQQYQELVPHLEDLYALFQVLLAARNKRGAIDFESAETRIVFGEDRKIERIIPVVRNDAHRLIEECMLMANVAAADFLQSHEIPALYRNHEPPGQEKLTDLREFLGELGLNLGGGDEPEPKHYAKLLEQVKGRLDAHLIQTVMLRSLRQAMYGAENHGHFGLAFDAYAHFTSPIRRYPDLLVHRAIRYLLSKKKLSDFSYSHVDMESLGDHCSMTERRADEATRDATDWLKCEYMQDKLGSEFDGIITSVTNFGIFVELTEVYVEGLVHVTALRQDYYHYDPVRHRMIGERTNKVYRLGDLVRVVVARVDLDDRKIDFELTDKQPESGAVRPSGRSRKTKAGKTKSVPDKADKQARNKSGSKRDRKARQHGGKKQGTPRSRKKKPRR